MPATEIDQMGLYCHVKLCVKKALEWLFQYSANIGGVSGGLTSQNKDNHFCNLLIILSIFLIISVSRNNQMDLYLRNATYTYIRTHDTGRSFEPIIMKFTRFVRVHSLVNPIVFGNNRPNRSADIGENVPPIPVFGFKSEGIGVFEEKTYKLYSVTQHPPHKKKLYSLLSVDAPFPQKWLCPQK